MQKPISQKHIILGVVVLSVVVLISAFIWEQNQESINPQIYLKSSLAPTSTTTATKPKPSQPTAPSLTYAKAVETYVNRRIQFDEQCTATPNPAMLRNGKEVMLDNRSAKGRSISIAGTSYYLSGYGFKIISLYRAKLPATLMINCGTGVNNGTITLQ